jgi:hypothetical protein
MWPENSNDRIVHAMKRTSGSLMGGSRMGWAESNKAASARPSKICETAIENKIETREPQVR